VQIGETIGVELPPTQFPHSKVRAVFEDGLLNTDIVFISGNTLYFNAREPELKGKNQITLQTYFERYPGLEANYSIEVAVIAKIELLILQVKSNDDANLIFDKPLYVGDDFEQSLGFEVSGWDGSTDYEFDWKVKSS